MSSKTAVTRHSNYARAALAGLSMIVLSHHPAFATSLVQQEFARWKIQDKCISDAVAQFPDRDADSQRQRDASVDACLKKHDMPPRAHVAPTDDQQVPVLQSH